MMKVRAKWRNNDLALNAKGLSDDKQIYFVYMVVGI